MEERKVIVTERNSKHYLTAIEALFSYYIAPYLTVAKADGALHEASA